MTPQAKACWERLKTGNPSADDARLYEVFSFGDSEALASELGDLVVSGAKRATASSVWSLEAEGKGPPKPGDYSIVTRWSGEPLCIIRTLAVDVVPFSEVSAEFAAAEGEGDGSLESWRAGHAAYFARECARLGREFSPAMPVVCEWFEVVGTGADDPAA